jgi:hypothetical protein
VTWIAVASLLASLAFGNASSDLRPCRPPGRASGSYAPIDGDCTIEIVQTRDGGVVFSGSAGIYRLGQG